MNRVTWQALCLGVVVSGTGCVEVPLLDELTSDAGSLAALEHRVDAAVAPWDPRLPGCGGQGAAGAGGDGPGELGGAGPDDGLDGGVDVAPVGPLPPSEAPAPGLPAPDAPGEVLITEIMVDPASAPDAQGEWFELFNPGTESLELSGCVIDDGGDSARVIGASFVIEPGQYRVVARSVVPGLAPDLLATFSLANEADRLGLSCGATPIDAVSYDRTQGFPLKAGASLSLDPAHFDPALNDSPGAWCAAVDVYAVDRGTPGAPNPSCAPVQP